MLLGPPKYRPSRFRDPSAGRDNTDQYFSDAALAEDPRQQRLDRIEREFVRRQIEALPPDAVVADVPCGNGRMSQYVTDRGDLQLVAMDFNPSMLDSMSVLRDPAMLPCRVRADALTLPLGDKSVDMVVNMRLLHHVTDDATRLRMLGELARVARSTIITSFWTTHCWRYVRRRLLGKSIRCFPIAPGRFKALCRQSGLDIRQIVYTGRWLEEQCLVVCQPQ